jgi:hypothetical protein
LANPLLRIQKQQRRGRADFEVFPTDRDQKRKAPFAKEAVKVE